MKLALVLVAFGAIFNCVSCEDGEPCKKGICRIVEDCEEALLDLKRGVSPTLCGFIGKQSLVCCGLTPYKIGDIAKEKCDEYSNKKFVVREIVGGVRSSPSQFSHMVALGYGQETNIQWNHFGDVKYIRAGTITLNPPDTTHHDFKVIQSIPHPSYTPPIHYDDIALIKLNASIEMTISVRPACLQTSSNVMKTFSAIGWGFLYNGGLPSNHLMAVDLVQYPYGQCNLTYSRDFRTLPKGIQEDSMICAGGKEDEEKDTCHGDSGGPLQITTSRHHTLIGITSFGKICGVQNIPGVYTKISNYIEWIENIVWA